MTANARNYYAAQTITNRIEPNRVTLYHSRCRWIFSKEFVQLPNIVCSIFDSFSNRIVAISEPFHQISLQLSMININWQIACLYLMSAPAPFFISFVFFYLFFLSLFCEFVVTIVKYQKCLILLLFFFWNFELCEINLFWQQDCQIMSANSIIYLFNARPFRSSLKFM